jgi:hypothetical protein
VGSVKSAAPGKVVSSQMDRKTMEQLRSLGYLSGSPEGDVYLNGEGADPKDRVAVLNAFESVVGPGSEKRSSGEKIATLEQALEEDPTNLLRFNAISLP